MRIGFLITYFHPFRDGTENQCLNLATELAKKHEIHIFTSDRRDGITVDKKYEIYNGVHIHRYKTMFRYRYYLCWNKNLISDLLKTDLDVLHVHSIGFPQQDLAVLLLKLLKPKLKIVNFPHGPFLANESYLPVVKIFREMYRILEKLTVNMLYDAIIDCSGRQKFTWMPRYFLNLNRVRCMPDGIPKAAFQKVNTKDFAQKYNLRKKFVICQLGRLVRYKGQEQVIKVLPDVIRECPNVVFLVMGPDRGYKAELERLTRDLGVEKHVIFTGEVSEEDKLKGLDLAEIICFTSVPGTEAFGIVVLEGMARRCALVSTKVEGGSALVEQGVNGFIYDYDDLPKLKEYMLKLIKDKKLREKMKKINFEWSKELVNEDIAWNYLEKIYLEITQTNIAESNGGIR